ncbi:MAG: tyrosine--tRNA ligase [Nitrososphaeria archaeon]|nr:tyrosine--tRNA ligase [Conexivisphaerales archaeon]
MNAEERYNLIAREPTEEIVTPEELKKLLESDSSIKHYIGLEISGPLHLGSLLIVGMKLKDFVQAGIKVTVFLADWHSYINEKLGKDLEKIKAVAESYKKAFSAFVGPGLNFMYGSELYESYRSYWEDLLKVATNLNLTRVSRTLTVAGRDEKEELTFAQFIYPLMQINDIHALDVDIAHGGTDQRKAHMLARDIFPKMGWKVPVAVHHHLLPGLQKPSEVKDETFSKMSKSKPSGAIFIHDSYSQIKEKLQRAWCPPGIVEGNPVMEIIKYIIMPIKGEFLLKREPKYGGDYLFKDFNELSEAYKNSKIHPFDLKTSTADYIYEIIKPVRETLVNDEDYVKIMESIGFRIEK